MPENSISNQENQDLALQDFQTKGEALQPENVQQSENQSVVNKKPGHKSSILKFVLLGIALILIIAGIIGAFILGKNSSNKEMAQTPTVTQSPSLSPKTDSTANWKTFNGTGFSFKYPANYKLNEEKSSDSLYPDLSLIFSSENSGNFRVLIYNNESLKEYIKNLCNNNCSNITDTKISSVNAKKIINPPSPISSELVVFENNNNLFSASVEQPNENSTPEINALSKQNFYQILSTFKFTDSNSQSSTDTSGWKAFSNKALSFNYPDSWTIEQSDYLNGIDITNATKTVAIRITEGAYPFGYGPGANSKTKAIKVTVDGKTYDTQEITLDDKELFVLFGPVSQKDHHILFGTKKSIALGESDSISDYEAEKETILQILKSLKFN